MGRVRQRGTSAEQVVAAMLRDLGLAYRRNVRRLPGAPDFANQRGRWAVFVNGCFWHAHKGCVKATVPTANRDFWLEKFEQNRRRDARAVKALRNRRFRVFIIWECELAQATSRLERLVAKSVGDGVDSGAGM